MYIAPLPDWKACGRGAGKGKGRQSAWAGAQGGMPLPKEGKLAMEQARRNDSPTHSSLYLMPAAVGQQNLPKNASFSRTHKRCFNRPSRGQVASVIRPVSITMMFVVYCVVELCNPYQFRATPSPMPRATPLRAARKRHTGAALGLRARAAKPQLRQIDVGRLHRGRAVLPRSQHSESRCSGGPSTHGLSCSQRARVRAALCVRSTCSRTHAYRPCTSFHRWCTRSRPATPTCTARLAPL